MAERFGGWREVPPQKLEEVEAALLSDEAVEATAAALSPYVGQALADIRANADHVLNVYRDRARLLLHDLAAIQTAKEKGQADAQ